MMGKKIIGSDFDTVPNEKLDKRNGRIGTHQRCRTFINNIIDSYILKESSNAYSKHFTTNA